MKYHFAQHLLLRQPVKRPVDYQAEPRIFLDDPFFQAALLVATPAFFQLIARKNFKAAELNSKEAHSLQKYINRYCFRPTPFGLFSAVSLVSWPGRSDQENSAAVFSAHIQTDMAVQQLLTEQLLENELRNVTYFEPNPSIYRVLNEYRFFRNGMGETGKHRNYQLQSIAYSKLLKDLITQAATGCSRDQLITHIRNAASCSAAEGTDYADFLIDSQLLVNQSRQTITGQDHLSQLAIKLPGGDNKERLLPLLQQELIPGDEIQPTRLAQLQQQVADLLPAAATATHHLNIILKKAVAVQPDLQKHQENIREGISALRLLTAPGQSVQLTNFIKNYQQYFEGQTLPLLTALDPEAGIGYQQPEAEKNNQLLETLHLAHQENAMRSNSWTAAHGVLMQAWLNAGPLAGIINLTDEALAPLRAHQEPEQLLGMSVLFRIAGEQVFIENAGGINAPALMGRFTLADEQIADAARNMAQQLESANPDIIFAELLHLADPHTDNVNRRAVMYNYEIPITAASSLNEARQLPLADLFVRIVNHQVILFSGQHQKIVLPRLTSAYNHSLNKLPLFRFLADLPYQYGRSNLSLDLRQLFPDLQYYPRVAYKNTILSLAVWVIPEKQIERLSAPGLDPCAEFIRLKEAIRLPKHFSLAEGDQELVFDSEATRDILFFIECVRTKKLVVLKEFIQQVEQYNAYLLPSDPLKLPTLQKSHVTKDQRKFMPGSEWLYLKIYGPKIGVNRLLLRLAPLLHKRYGGDKISQWFFIRYDDHAPHIRLRLKVKPESISEVLIAFKQKLEDRIQQQVIREFQLDIYSRELERYASGGITNTERFFWASSELVLRFLKLQKVEPAVTTYSFALCTTYAIFTEFMPATDAQIEFTSASFQSFLPEFPGRTIKVELDKKYRELSVSIQQALSQSEPALRSGSLKAANNFRQSLQQIQQHLSREFSDPDYLRSIIHLHLNRIFTDESRKQEMICYYLLHKYLLSVRARNKKPG